MLELFPAAVLDNSILTSVLVGLWITWLFQETYGWNFTGLVVPGYLASIFSIEPATGAVITVEAALTYALVYGLSEVAPVHWPTSRLFGRDRFFALLLASVTIRLAVEGYALDGLEAYLGYRLSPALHSMGLLVMPLAANALWRTGMARGVVRLGIPVFLTWLVVDFVLLPFTNLSLTSFELTYEDLALDFVTSPRAYFLLLVGAWLGSVFNRSYGFDFGGIIVPGLLTVCWMFPVRIVTTIVEGILAAVLLRGLLALPGLRGRNLGGGRLIVVAFTMMYVVKLGLGWVVVGGWPGTRVSELFGFGYLLPTIIALRVHKHGQPFRTLVPSLVTSVVAFLGATAFGWALMQILPPADRRFDTNADSDLILAAYGNLGPRPARREMRQSTLGGEGFGALERRNGFGPAIVARLGVPGVGKLALQVADVVDARAVLLCAPLGDACRDGWRQLESEGPTWHLEATNGASEIRLHGNDARGVDLAALQATVPDLAIGAAAPRRTRLLLGRDVRYAGEVPERRTAPVRPGQREELDLTSMGDLRVARYEVAPLLREWHDGDEQASSLLATTAGWVDSEVVRDDDRLGLVGPDTWVGIRRDSRDLIVHVPDADQPGALPFALALAEQLDARAIVADSPPSLTTERYERRRVALALLTGLLEQWPEADVLEIQGLRDVYDVRAEVAWSTGWQSEEPALLGPVQDALGLGISAYTGTLDRMALQRSDSPLRHRGRDTEHLILFVSTRVRHRIVPFHDPVDIPRAFTVGPRRHARPDWSESWRAPIRDADSDVEWRALRNRAARENVELEAACHVEDSCPWIVLTRCEDGPCERAWLPRYRGIEGALSPLGTD